MTIPDRQHLLHALRQQAYQYHDPPKTLRSGRLSHHYIDCASILLQPYYLDYAAGLMAALVSSHFGTASLAAVLSGAAELTAATCLLTRRGMMRVRSDAKEGKDPVQMFRGLGKTPPPAIVVEDVTTTGGSAHRARLLLEERGCEVLGLVSLVDREEWADDVPRFKKQYSIYTLAEVQDPSIVRRPVSAAAPVPTPTGPAASTA